MRELLNCGVNLMADGALPIAAWCRANHVSLTTYYKLKSLGKGPREMKVGAKRLISPQATLDWYAQMEAEPDIQTRGRPPKTAKQQVA
jgi:hypothetical protein